MHIGTFQYGVPCSGTCYAGVWWNVWWNVVGNLRVVGTCHAGVLRNVVEYSQDIFDTIGKICNDHVHWF